MAEHRIQSIEFKRQPPCCNDWQRSRPASRGRHSWRPRSRPA